MTLDELKSLLIKKDSLFWEGLTQASYKTEAFDEILFLSNLRKKGLRENFKPYLKPLRLALIGGYTFYPLQDLVEHFLSTAGFSVELFIGDFDNYHNEILDTKSKLHRFKPEIVCLFPSGKRCFYSESLADSVESQRSAAENEAAQLIELCQKVNQHTGAEVILSNFILPSGFDPGPIRTKSLGSEWNFKKLVNMELGLKAPAFVSICDSEFLTCRKGTLVSQNDREWYESKQPCSPSALVDVAKELSHIVSMRHKAAKKVLVLDLDNTLWGGVVGDDGLEGIELGDTSPRGEAFKSFQRYILSLKERGVLLAVCSKNDHEKAIEPFEKHPEAVLRLKDFVGFKANWNPKSENIKALAEELNLGLDSFVFVDDNPAEIEIVRQFVPEVTPLLIGPDPADYLSQLQNCRLFEPSLVTEEDRERTKLYQEEAKRQQLKAKVTDMDSYLTSLEMMATVKPFNSLDVPRISQLINKSNQFNLTTKRQTEAEVLNLMSSPAFYGFTIRLKDKFGDHGLIAIIVLEFRKTDLFIDTWLMSCRVLSRQVEELTFNEILRVAQDKGYERVLGQYIQTKKNGMVKEHYPKLGFDLLKEEENGLHFELRTKKAKMKTTKITLESN